MSRIAIAFSITPLLACIFPALLTASPLLAIFGLVFIYPLTLLLALPAFLLCKKLKWLQWWHAVGAGLLISALFVLFWDSSINPYHVEIHGIPEASIYMTTGYAAGLIFWFIGLFRNPSYPYVRSGFVILSIVPLLLLISLNVYLHQVLKISEAQGTITVLLPPVENKPMAQVKLTSGSTVVTRLMCYHSYHPGTQIHLVHRSASMIFKERYWALDAISPPGLKFDLAAWQKESEACLEETLR